MGFWQAVITVIFKKYVKFSGRASRSEFWWFMLFYAIYYVLTFAIEVLIALPSAEYGEPVSRGFAILDFIFLFILFLPRLGLTVRRLHDLNFSGWWSIVLVGLLIIAYLPFLELILSQEIFYRYKISSIIRISKFILMLLALVLMIVLIRKGTMGPNKYGQNPVKLNIDASVFA